jgi:hypothetical protein
MRTTVDLDERILVAARAIARDERISLGAAISRLALRGLQAGVSPPDPAAPGGFPKFVPAADAPPITLEVVNQHRDGD